MWHGLSLVLAFQSRVYACYGFLYQKPKARPNWRKMVLFLAGLCGYRFLNIYINIKASWYYHMYECWCYQVPERTVRHRRRPLKIDLLPWVMTDPAFCAFKTNQALGLFIFLNAYPCASLANNHKISDKTRWNHTLNMGCVRQKHPSGPWQQILG